MRYLLIILFVGLTGSRAIGQDGFVDGIPAIAYWKIGHQKEVVIVIHGGPAAEHSYLRPELDGLATSGTVIYYDQRGVGKSQATTTYSWQEHVDDLKRLIKSVSKKKKVFLAGSSWGSMLAVLYAYTYPATVKGLILSGTVAWEGKGLNASQFDAYRNERYPDRKPLSIIPLKLREHRMVETIDGGSQRQEIRSIEKEVQLYAGPQSAETRIGWAAAPVLDSLRSIKTPVLLFNGDFEDCSVDWASRYMTIFPNVELCTVPAACHDPWFSNPDMFTKRCATFMRKNR